MRGNDGPAGRCASAALGVIAALAPVGSAPARGEAPARPDLVVTLSTPSIARPGEEIGRRTRLVVLNRGAAVARGTRDNPAGFMIDVTLGRDSSVAVGFKAYSPRFSEDVLLEGGRISRTADLAPRGACRYPLAAVLPEDVPQGGYFLCAYVDAGNAVPESDETNNSACAFLRVDAPRTAATPAAQGPPAGAERQLRGLR
jgi:hypothetical protein